MAKRLGADVDNATYRTELLKMAEDWEREALIAEAARARRDAAGRG